MNGLPVLVDFAFLPCRGLTPNPTDTSATIAPVLRLNLSLENDPNDALSYAPTFKILKPFLPDCTQPESAKVRHTAFDGAIAMSRVGTMCVSGNKKRG